MPASIYLYESLKEYMLFYPTSQPKDTETPILSFYLAKPYGVWAVVNIENKLGPVSMKSSLNVILNGMNGFKKLINVENVEIVKLERDDIKFYYKKNHIIFQSEDFVKQFTVSRYVGKPLSQGRWKDWLSPTIPIAGYMFFDYARNRINLILEENNPLISSSNIASSLD